MKTVLYIHGKGGNASESTHYENLFPDCKVIGLDYKTFSPWETGKEIHDAVASLKKEVESIILIANSIGAFFSMNANLNGLIEKAYFISPVVNMEKLIWKNDSAYHQNDCTNQDATVYDSLHDAVGIIFSFENPSIPAAVQKNVNAPENKKSHA